MRNLVNRGFTPRKIAALEPRVRAIARDLLAKLEPQGRVRPRLGTTSIPLPVTVIAELLGVEPERSADFKRWSDAAVAGSTGAAGGYDRGVDARGLLRARDVHDRRSIEERRRAPQDDLISTLIRAEQGETALTPTEVVMFTLLLLVAGNETTTNLLGNTLLALIAHPERARARARASRRASRRWSKRRCATTARSSSSFREAREDSSSPA